ncbi:DnaJ domain-containing protein [Xylaria sp. FL1777]|nr:DnaJ domain-containing protein [Xylaria sp. FL1777]
MLNKIMRRGCSTIYRIVCIFIILVYIGMLAKKNLGLPAEEASVTDPPPTHYDILNVSIHASNSEIKRAYRKRVLPYHPDKVQRLSALEQANAKRKFDEITHSYEFLTSDKRCFYDRRIMKGGYEQYVLCIQRALEKRWAALERTRKEKDGVFEEEQEFNSTEQQESNSKEEPEPGSLTGY